MKLQRTLAKILGMTLLVLLAGMGLSTTAQAHALLVRSIPEADAVLSAAPGSIELWFTEAVEPGFSRARLYDASGQEVPGLQTKADPSDDTHLVLPGKPLAPGVYTVAWQTLSKTDGHEFSGSFPFTILNPDGTRPNASPASTGGASRGELPSPGETLARWILLLGSCLLFGTALFQAIIVPANSNQGPEPGPFLGEDTQVQAVLAVWLAVLGISAAQFLHLIFQTSGMGGLSVFADLLLKTQTGALLLARQVIALSILLVSLKLPQPAAIRSRQRVIAIALIFLLLVEIGFTLPATISGGILIAVPSFFVVCLALGLYLWFREEDTSRFLRKVWGFLVIGAAIFLLEISLGSHAGAGSGSFWAVLADFLHLAAAGAWIGGLLRTGALVRKFLRSSRSEQAQTLLYKIVRRFSYLAGLSVFILTLTGLFNSLVQLPQISLLWETTYGRVLLLKLGFIALAMGAAFLNNLLVHRGTGSESGISFTRLRSQMAIEIGVVFMLVLSVAVLVQTPTPRDAANLRSVQQPDLPFMTVVTADDLSIHVMITPNVSGTNRFWMHVFHYDGSDVGEIQRVQLRFNYQDVALGEAKVNLAPAGKDEYAVEGAFLSQAGAWDLTTYIQRRGMDDTLIKFNLDVPAPNVKRVPLNPLANPIPFLHPIWIVAAFFLAITLVPLIWHQPLRELWPSYRFTRHGIYVVLVSGLITGLLPIGYGVFFTAPPVTSQPRPVDFEKGKTLYAENCSSCHGPTGLGDGPQASQLNPPPANLQVHLAQGSHSDTQIYRWISNGIPNTGMPAFSSILSEDERWLVVSYARSLVPRK